MSAVNSTHTPNCVSPHSCVVYPLATSTPRVAYTTAENGYKENRPLETAGQPGQVGLPTIRESVTSDTAVTDTDAPTRRSSTGSDLTHISTTDISSHGDEESDHENLNTNMNNATEVAMPTVPLQLPTTGITPSGESGGEGSPKSLDLSDVVVSVGSSTLLDSTTTLQPDTWFHHRCRMAQTLVGIRMRPSPLLPLYPSHLHLTTNRRTPVPLQSPPHLLPLVQVILLHYQLNRVVPNFVTYSKIEVYSNAGY